jgi:hypothetical protein
MGKLRLIAGSDEFEEQVSALRRRTLSQGDSRSQEFFEPLRPASPARVGKLRFDEGEEL